MRLYNTLTRRKDDLPAQPGPVRMYVCGPTVYARAHVGNARPFILGMWLRSWLRETGYETTLVHNITDINDRIYEAAPGASAELAERATAWYLEDTGDLGLGMPDELPRATEMVPQIVATIETLVESGYAYAVEGDVYYRVARFPDYGALSGQRPDQVEEQEPNPRKEDARDFALWKANKPDEDTWWDSPWGRGRPGWHIECSVMAEELLGPAFEIHGGGLDLVFPHHENEIAQSRALGHDFAALWMHNGMLRFTDEKMSKSLGNVITLRDAIDRWGRETLLVFFLTGHWRKPIDYSDETIAAAEARAERFRDVFRAPSESAGADAWPNFAAALDDDFNTPEALAAMHEWRDHDLLRRALALFGLDSLARQETAPPEVRSLAEQRAAARAGGDWTEADRLRAEIEGRGWDRARRRRRRRLPARAALVSGAGSDQVYGRRAVRELLRGRRQALELWATERALTAEPWLQEARPRVQVRPERELTAAAGTRDHQGVLARAEPYRYADAWELAAADRPLLVCLDRVSDPRNLGAVCRSAEGAGATGLVLPEHGSARVTPVVCKTSAGAVEHLPVAVVTNLARYLDDVKGLPCGSTARAPTQAGRCGTPSWPGAPRSCSARRAAA